MLKKLGSKLKEQKGFTLIELLAVIVILGIIAAIAIPAIGNVIKKSEDKSTVQEGLLIIDAAKLYIANNPPADADLPLTLGTTLASTDEKSLAGYVDRVEGEFTVTVDKDGTSGSYTYILTEHAAEELADKGTDGASVQELLEFGK